MSKSASPIRSFVAEHPKWIGVLFWLTVLLTQAGMAAGNNVTGTAGP
jgi:hypothetical protein